MAEDNVVKMPDRLERRAQKIEAAMKRRESGNLDWIEGTIELAIELAGAREDCGTDDNRFGKWLRSNFGENRLSRDEQGILIQWGKDPDQVRVMLQNTDSRSIQGIHRRYRSATKGADEGCRSSPKPPSGGAKTNKAKAFAQAYEVEHGQLPPERLVARETGVSQGVSADALRDLRSRRSEADGHIVFSKAQDRHVEARIKVLDKAREADFKERVRLAMLENNAAYLAGLEGLEKQAREKQEFYETLVNQHRPIFTRAEYTDILFCAHNDHVERERKHRAATSLIAKKLQLTGEK